MAWLTGLLFLILSVIVITIILKISSQVSERLHQMTQQVDSRLNQMSQSIQDSNKAITQGLGSATNIVGGVHEKLGKLEATNQQIIEISKDISSLQELLRAPKFRGQMGETFLENLLAQVLPKDHYEMQYRFKSQDAVDAVIKLGGRLVPIDAKFSLENFQKMQGETDEQTKNSFHKKFMQDVKNRVDEIASKYILPQENTYDFGFMYIPAENVYYEVTVKEDLLGYFNSKKVIPVSPNTFYAYLQVICLGLKGLKIEENAKEILKGLSSLNLEIAKFREEFDLLGKHIANSKLKYDDSSKRLEKFSERLNSIQDTRQLEAEK